MANDIHKVGSTFRPVLPGVPHAKAWVGERPHEKEFQGNTFSEVFLQKSRPRTWRGSEAMLRDI